MLEYLEAITLFRDSSCRDNWEVLRKILREKVILLACPPGFDTYKLPVSNLQCLKSECLADFLTTSGPDGLLLCAFSSHSELQNRCSDGTPLMTKWDSVVDIIKDDKSYDGILLDPAGHWAVIPRSYI